MRLFCCASPCAAKEYVLISRKDIGKLSVTERTAHYEDKRIRTSRV